MSVIRRRAAYLAWGLMFATVGLLGSEPPRGREQELGPALLAAQRLPAGVNGWRRASAAPEPPMNAPAGAVQIGWRYEHARAGPIDVFLYIGDVSLDFHDPRAVLLMSGWQVGERRPLRLCAPGEREVLRAACCRLARHGVERELLHFYVTPRGSAGAIWLLHLRGLCEVLLRRPPEPVYLVLVTYDPRRVPRAGAERLALATWARLRGVRRLPGPTPAR